MRLRLHISSSGQLRTRHLYLSKVCQTTVNLDHVGNDIISIAIEVSIGKE